jgi:2-polyprenyl-6-methoxyphenol hydroxylase-like FAD-dependent oxidoreductase
LEDGTQIQPKLLVGSDGEKSLTRSEYKIGSTGHSYGQKGLVCTVSCL